MFRVDLDIIVEHKPDGKVLPRTILWPDGRKFKIDKTWMHAKHQHLRHVA